MFNTSKHGQLAGSIIYIVILASVNRMQAQEQVFFGNLHSHTSYSDGSGTPDDAYRHAREVAHLDFLAITEHNHRQAENGAGERRDGILIAKDHSLYTGPQPEALIPAANKWTENGKFVAIYGQEFSSISQGNHANVFDVPRVIDVLNGRFDLLVNNWIPANLDSSGKPAIIQFNHPSISSSPDSIEYGRDDFADAEEWIRKMDSVAYLIEILNGPAMAETDGHRPQELMEHDYIAYLNLGFHLAPTADQDNHYRTWGSVTDARTAIIAEELSKAKLFEAIRKRHVYATEDKNLRVICRVNGHLCGDRFPAPEASSELKIAISINDSDEPDASYHVEVFSDTIGGSQKAESIDTISVDGNTANTVSIEDVNYTGGVQYIFFKITQLSEDGQDDHAWTAPVWLEPAGIHNAGGEAATLVASKNSSIYHVSLDCHGAQRIKESNRVFGAVAKAGRIKHEGCPK